MPSSDLRAQEIASYDDQGRVYKTQVYDVNPSNGSVSSTALTTNDYYDHRGDLMAESDPGGLWTKSQFDGAGRDTMDYTTDGAGGTSWSAASSVTSDTVLEQEQNVYDGDSNVIETIDSQRFHNDTSTQLGPLGSPSSGIGARVYYAAAYYDNADRLIASVDAGTNGGTAWTRPSTVPASSSTLLVTNNVYNGAGWLQDVIDPMGIDTRTNYDNLGRVTQTIADYTNGTETAESNISTEYGYDGNDNLLYVQADQPGGSYQKTAYVYGVTTAAGDGLNSNDILAAVQHPDPTTGNPSSSQQDSYLVNALGETVQATDRNGNVHQYTYDVLGRMTSDAVTTLGAGVDGTIRRISYAYDSQGNLSLITSYDAPTAGNIVNQVQRVFNGLGQLTGEYQSHSGAVVQGTTPEVQYAYTEMSGGQNNSRLVSMTYPHGYSLEYTYNTGLDSNISRLSSISDSNGVQESYKYLGLDTVVERDHPQTNVNLTYIQQTGDPYANTDGGDQYTGLDRFGRVIDQFWIDASNSTTVDRYQYGYNQDGDVLYKQNLVNTAMSEVYTYDNLNQLTSFQRGTLNSTKTGIQGTPSRSQSYTPDALGNFNSVTTNGSTQTRTANQQNEITSISGQNAPTYDANGNLTADGTGNTYVYDAWNRLVTIQNNGTTVESYRYDGLNRQIQVLPGAGGSPLDLYVSAADQVLEEYQNKQVVGTNVWSPVYVNALVMRIPYVGSTNPTQYVIQDANWNVTALVDMTNDVLERYAYDPYGAITVMSSSWVVKSSSAYNVPYGFQGMRYDWSVNLIITPSGRIVSPTLMRPLQQDYLGLAPDDNPYRWEGNGPTDAIDPSGLATASQLWGQNQPIPPENTAHKVAWWFLDNTLGLGSTVVSMLGVPNFYRAAREKDDGHRAWFSFYKYTFYKDPVNSYNAYRAQGLSKEDAIGFTFMHQVPGISSVWGGAEMIAGYSTRPGEVGKPLTTGDYITRFLDIGRDSAFLGYMCRPRGLRPTAPNAPGLRRGPGTAANPPPSLGRIPATATRPVPRGYTRAYRAVSEAEYQQIRRTGRFEVGPLGAQGKWFADSLEGAQAHGRGLYPDGKFRLIEADVPNNAPSLIKWQNLDRKGPARFLDVTDLKDVKPRPVE